MAPGAFRTLLFSVLALLLSAGHSVCAGLTPVASHGAEHNAGHQQHAAVDPASIDPESHSGHGDMHAVHETGADQPAPCGPEADNCQHCSNATFYKAPVTSEYAAPVNFASDDTSVFAADVAFHPHTPQAMRTYSSHRWRGPPGETPISLKIRLLI